MLGRGAAGAGDAVARLMRRAPRRLPDADRQPRGRDAAGAQRAARRRRRRLRGHAPHARAARPLRGRAPRRSATTSTTSASGRPSSSSGCARAPSWRWSATPGCRWSAIRASCWCRRASRPGWRSRCCRGRARRWPRWSPARCRPRRWRFVGFLPRKRGELAALFAAPETLVAFESPRRVAASLAVLAAVDPARPGGRVPRADEGPRGGRARDARPSWPRATPERRRGRDRPGGRRGGARARATRTPALDALRRLVDAGARARAGRAASSRSSPGRAPTRCTAR